MTTKKRLSVPFPPPPPPKSWWILPFWRITSEQFCPAYTEPPFFLSKRWNPEDGNISSYLSSSFFKAKVYLKPTFGMVGWLVLHWLHDVIMCIFVQLLIKIAHGLYIWKSTLNKDSCILHHDLFQKFILVTIFSVCSRSVTDFQDIS